MSEQTDRDLESFEDDPDLSPVDQARRRYSRWKIELDAARKELKGFQKEGREASARFRDERPDSESENSIEDNRLRRLNVYSADIQGKRDELFGNVPKSSSRFTWMSAEYTLRRRSLLSSMLFSESESGRSSLKRAEASRPSFWNPFSSLRAASSSIFHLEYLRRA